jgi:hypothetical protein
MTTEKEYTNIFKADLLLSKTVDNIKFEIYSNRIMYVRFPKFEKITPKVIEQGYALVEEVGGGKFYNIYHFDSFFDVEPEIREWAANEDGNLNTYSDAIVIGNISQKILTDFYIRFNKPAKPTKVFFSLDKAIDWSLKNQTK